MVLPTLRPGTGMIDAGSAAVPGCCCVTRWPCKLLTTSLPCYVLYLPHSHPVITGFTSGAALVIATGQVRAYSVPKAMQCTEWHF